MAAQRAILFGNPTAQSGRASAAIDAAVEALAALGIEASVVPNEPAGRTPALVARTIGERTPDIVLALGGDGTFNEVARGILSCGADVPMGMLPMGTANDQGRSFGLVPGAAHVSEHARIVVAGHETRLDVGRIVGKDAAGATVAEGLFFDSASFGLAPDILAARNRDRTALDEGPLKNVKHVPILGELFRDQAIYVGAAIDRIVASVVEPSRFSAVVRTDRFERTWSALTDLVVKATPIFAGAWVLDPLGEPDDGLFELIAVETRADWITRVASDLATSPFRADQIGILHREHLAASRFDIALHSESARGAVASQIDGEEWHAGERFEIEVLPRRLRLLTPAGFVPPWKAK